MSISRRIAAGIALAGRPAEVVFTGGKSAEDFRRNRARMRDAAAAAGRSPDDLRFLVQAGIVVGRTEAEATRKWDTYRQFTSLDGILAHASVPLDLTAFDGSLTVAEAAALAGADVTGLGLALERTVAETLDAFRRSREDRYFVVGTPGVVADEIERWLDEDGIDGINLRQYHSFDTLRDVAELVVPELRRRGRLREDSEPTTLRDRLFGAGDHLPETHPARR